MSIVVHSNTWVSGVSESLKSKLPFSLGNNERVIKFYPREGIVIDKGTVTTCDEEQFLAYVKLAMIGFKIYSRIKSIKPQKALGYEKF